MASPSVVNEYPLELTPPDLAAYAKGNTGVPFVWTFQSGKPGPHVMISALVHGNELCGAIALDWLMQRDVRPLQGSLSLMFANVAAFNSFDASDPNASRFVDEDFNRLWGDGVLDSDRQSIELTRARQLRPVVDTVDLLLDIHSMQHAAIPLMMAGPVAKGRVLARQVATPQTIISDVGHAAGKRMRCYAPFIDEQSPRNALLVECGQHWAASSATLAIDCAVRFLRVCGSVDSNFAPDIGVQSLPPVCSYEVTDVLTIQSEHFTFAQPFHGGEILPEQGSLLGHDGSTPVTTPYPNCMLVMPSKRLTRGQTAVRLAREVA